MTMKVLTIFGVLISLFFLSAHADDPFYDGCGTTKTCLGYPEDCLPDKDCVTLSATYKKDGKYYFEMRSYKGAKYIAMGLSRDRNMGEDAVIECVKDGDQVKIFGSYTEIVDGDYKATREGTPQDNIRLIESKIEDNRIFCLVERDALTTVRGNQIDLDTKNYYLLLASGTSIEKGSVGYHDYAYTPSDKKVKY